MSNTILTPTAVTREALRVLHQKLNFVGTIHRDYDDSFAQKEAKIGDTLKIRLPNQYTVRTGAALQAQDTSETSVSLVINNQKGVDLNFTSVDLTLSLQDFSDRILEPAMSVLAANIEYDAMSMYKDVWQSVWNAGSALTLAHVLNGKKKLTDALVPLSNRTANIATQPMVDLINDAKTLFNDQDAISQQYKEGYVKRASGFDFYENTMWPRHARGAANTSYTTDTRTSALATDGTAYATITVAAGSGSWAVGDVFEIANVNRVHPETKADTGVAHQFVVTAALAGTGTLSISPSIVLGGARQNCTIGTTSASAVITVKGTASGSTDLSLLYHKDAFAFATADLQMPNGVDMAAREVMDGISMRLVRQYDINSDKFPCRLDVLYGYKTIRGSQACRLHNNS